MDTIRHSAPRARQNSATATPKPTQDFQTPKGTSSNLPSSNAHYTVFIRLPFPRGHFEDPPPVEWDSIKDKALWKLISTASSSKELDWEAMSTRFNVTLSFLLQQAAWLYERHFDAMKAQMKRLSAASAAPSGSASPAPDGGVKVEGGAGGVAMSRTGSRDAASVSAYRRSSLRGVEAGSIPGTPRSHGYIMSRTGSTNTVTQQSRFSTSPRQPGRNAGVTQGRPLTPTKPQRESLKGDQIRWGQEADAADGSESDEDASVLRSKPFTRSRFGPKPAADALSWDGDAEDDEEEESSGGSLPFATSAKSTSEDPSSTLRKSPKRPVATPQPAPESRPKSKELQLLQNEPSKSSSRPTTAKVTTSERPNANNRSEPLSPQQRAQLEKLSPKYQKSSSDGSPSIGSSFSDLDDVTQSALEDALMSNMQYGSLGMGAGSRMSTPRDALGRQNK